MQVSAPCRNMDYMTTTHQGQVPCIPKGLLNEFDSILGGVWDDLINVAEQFLDMTCVDYFTGSCQWHCKAGASVRTCFMGGCPGAAGHGLYPGCTR